MFAKFVPSGIRRKKIIEDSLGKYNDDGSPGEEESIITAFENVDSKSSDLNYDALR